MTRKVSPKGGANGGKVAVDQLWRGDSILKIIPTQRQLLTSIVHVEVRDRMKPIEVRITRLAPKKVLVVDAKGRPIPNVRVEVVDPGTMLLPGDAEYVNDERSGSVVSCPEPGHRYPSRIDEAITDDGGQCIVYGIPGQDDHQLRLYRDTVPRLMIEGVEFGPAHLSRRIRLDH